MEKKGALDRAELDVRGRITEQILSEVNRSHDDDGGVGVFLCYFYNAHFDPAGFDELRRMGIPSINFYCNSICQLDLVADIASNVDISWHAERNARTSYLEIGARPVWVQMGAAVTLRHAQWGFDRSQFQAFL